jgi:HEPN domain-containing protein
MTPLTREWLRKADDDRRLAERAFYGRPALYDGACYHCQQAVEKYFKGLSNELGLPLLRVHDLEQLLNPLQAHDPTLRSLRRVVRGLTRYAVDYRYPGSRTNRRNAIAALAKMERVRAEVRRRLGLRK